MPLTFPFRRRIPVALPVLAASLCLLLNGCIVVNKKEQNGKKQDSVSIAVPFAGMHVQTNQTTAADLGLPAYPGSIATTGSGKDQSANVDMGFGPWKLRVKVVHYTTPDPQAKVVTYYRNALSQFSTVIACNGNTPDGKPTRTDQGLTCSSSDKQVNVNDDNADSGFSLRAGSPHHQRIVAFTSSSGKGTSFTLVELVLPDHSGSNGTPD